MSTIQTNQNMTYQTPVVAVTPGKALTPHDLPMVYLPQGSVGVIIGATLLTMLTFGIAYPWAMVMWERHKASHTYINGRQLVFYGDGSDLFVQWLKWALLMMVTFGIYGFVVYDRLHKWVTEHTRFA